MLECLFYSVCQSVCSTRCVRVSVLLSVLECLFYSVCWSVCSTLCVGVSVLLSVLECLFYSVCQCLFCPCTTAAVCVAADCLASFTEVEELEDSELYMCSNCKRRQKSTKKFWIRRLPNVSWVMGHGHRVRHVLGRSKIHKMYFLYFDLHCVNRQEKACHTFTVKPRNTFEQL